MECRVKDEQKQHLSNIRKLTARLDLISEEMEFDNSGQKFAISPLRDMTFPDRMESAVRFQSAFDAEF